MFNAILGCIVNVAHHNECNYFSCTAKMLLKHLICSKGIYVMSISVSIILRNAIILFEVWLLSFLVLKFHSLKVSGLNLLNFFNFNFSPNILMFNFLLQKKFATIMLFNPYIERTRFLHFFHFVFGSKCRLTVLVT